jgi:hypothetical protein
MNTCFWFDWQIFKMISPLCRENESLSNHFMSHFLELIGNSKKQLSDFHSFHVRHLEVHLQIFCRSKFKIF